MTTNKLNEVQKMVDELISHNPSGYEVVRHWHRGVLAGHQIKGDYLWIIAVRTPAMRQTGTALQIGVSHYPINSATYHANDRLGSNIRTCDPIEPQLAGLAEELSR